MEPITSGDSERSNAGRIQEKFGQSAIRSALIWVPALSRGLTQWLYRSLPTQLFYNLKLKKSLVVIF